LSSFPAPRRRLLASCLILAGLGTTLALVSLAAPARSPVRPATSCPALNPGSRVWHFDALGDVSGAPAVAADGTVYFGTKSGLLYAVDCHGTERWVFDYRRHTANGFGAQAFEGSPAVGDDGTIYIGDDVIVPNYMFALWPDGKPKWVYETWGGYSQMDTSPALDRRGRIFMGSQGWLAGVSLGSLLAFDPDGGLLMGFDGNIQDAIVGPVTASPIVLTDDSVVFLAPSFHTWTLPTPTGTSPTPTATETARPTPTTRPTLTRRPPPSATSTEPTPTATVPGTATDPDTPVHLPLALSDKTPRPPGRQIRPDQPLPPPNVTVPVPARLHIVRNASAPPVSVDLGAEDPPSSPAGSGQTIVFGLGRTLQAWDIGPVPRRLWEHDLGAEVAGAPLLGRLDPATGAREVVYVGTDGTLVVQDVAPDGSVVKERWRRRLGLPVPGVPALGDDDHVYVAAGRSVLALSRSDGSLAWSAMLDADVSSSVTLAPGGTLYVGTQDGTLYAFGTGSGGLDSKAAWPAFRHDERNTGRVAAEP
jgi:outer membrane protein assembly factor BamB